MTWRTPPTIVPGSLLEIRSEASRDPCWIGVDAVLYSFSRSMYSLVTMKSKNPSSWFVNCAFVPEAQAAPQ